jgi:hypothetical protein
MRIELTTSSLPRKCSTPELQRLVASCFRASHPVLSDELPAGAQQLMPGPSPAPVDNHRLRPTTTSETCGPSCMTLSGRRGSNPRPTAWKAVALPTELLPHEKNICDPIGHYHYNLIRRMVWARMDSNHRTRKRTDLQSVVVGHLTTRPAFIHFGGA